MKISTDSFIELLRVKGFSLQIDGKDILISGPLDTMTLDMEKALREHKTEIIEILQREQISFMTLDDFGRKNYAVRIYSRVLNEEVYFCSNERMRDAIRHTGLSAYLPGELKHLIRSSPDEEALKAIDDAKSIFPGSELIESKETH